MKNVLRQDYPDYFPQGCPPDEANTDDKELFRFCEEITPEVADFISYYQKFPEKYRGKINAYGLSVLQSREDCLRAYRKIPYLRKYKSIAQGVTDFNRGSWKVTPGKISPAHVTWLVCEGVTPNIFFEFDILTGDEYE